MKIFKFLILQFCFISLGFSVSQKEIKQKRTELKTTQQLIRQKDLVKKKFVEQEAAVFKELKDIENKLKKLESEKTEILKKIEVVTKQLNFVKNEIENLTTDIEFYKRYISIELNRFVNEYILISPFYEDNFLRKLKKIGLREQALQLKTAQLKKDYAERLHTEYLKHKTELENYNFQLAEKQKQQKKLFLQKNAILNDIKKKRTKVETEIAMLKKTQQELELVLKKLEQKYIEKIRREMVGKEQKYVPQIKEKFIKPISGEVVSKFGKTTDADVCIIRNGVIIQGISFSDVVSINKGKVIFVSQNFRSYGKMIIIEHKDEIYSIYGQLGEIKVVEGQQVEKGTIIAKTNRDGELYFELRKGLVPVDPELYFE